MTYADEEFLPEGQGETPNYPTAFGITFTPRIGGVIFAVLGLLGATYLFINVVQPEWQRNQELKDKKEQTQKQVDALKDTEKQIAAKKAELEQAKLQNKQVLNLFANDKSMDTLVLDLNNIIVSRKGTLKLLNPGENPPATDGVVKDGSLGPLVNDKLKRKTISVELEGSFDQIQSIIRSFERLQSLLLVKDFKLEQSDQPVLVVLDANGTSVPGIRKRDNQEVIANAKPNLKATFKLELLSPVKTEEPSAITAKPGLNLPGQNPAR